MCWSSIVKLFDKIETVLCFIDDGLCPLTNDTRVTNEVVGKAVWRYLSQPTVMVIINLLPWLNIVAVKWELNVSGLSLTFKQLKHSLQVSHVKVGSPHYLMAELYHIQVIYPVIMFINDVIGNVLNYFVWCTVRVRW